MKTNMGNADRWIRLLIAATALVLYFTSTVSGTLGIVLLVLAIIFALTSMVKFCPIYAVFGMRSCPAE